MDRAHRHYISTDRLCLLVLVGSVCWLALSAGSVCLPCPTAPRSRCPLSPPLGVPAVSATHCLGRWLLATTYHAPLLCWLWGPTSTTGSSLPVSGREEGVVSVCAVGCSRYLWVSGSSLHRARVRRCVSGTCGTCVVMNQGRRGGCWLPPLHRVVTFCEPSRRSHFLAISSIASASRSASRLRLRASFGPLTQPTSRVAPSWRFFGAHSRLRLLACTMPRSWRSWRGQRLQRRRHSGGALLPTH